jgi:hypothetical protein
MTKRSVPRFCTVDGCDRPFEAREMCARHYKAWRKLNLDQTDAGTRTPAIERFWRSVDTTDPDGCWPWMRGTDAYGYGSLMVDGKTTKAHRYSYWLMTGQMPDTLDHLCRNRLCVNPAHLEPTSRGENVLRGTGFAAANAAKTTCPNGHQYDYAEPGGSRRCKACRNAKRRERHSRLQR